MITRIQKWGNSQGLRLSRTLLADIDAEIGDEVDVTVQDGTLVITPVRRVRGGHRLRDLLRRLPKDAPAGELEWGPPRGREAW
ncbi:MAG: transcriptional regulator/antitoxin, MazE [Gemmatimonadetes bacterium]|nr:transcriptional regulator/antitoxin, MazE [Gemmatimonadota bacterium]